MAGITVAAPISLGSYAKTSRVDQNTGVLQVEVDPNRRDDYERALETVIAKKGQISGLKMTV